VPFIGSVTRFESRSKVRSECHWRTVLSPLTIAPALISIMCRAEVTLIPATIRSRSPPLSALTSSADCTSRKASTSLRPELLLAAARATSVA
jgi:hypothetical protein